MKIGVEEGLSQDWGFIEEKKHHYRLHYSITGFIFILLTFFTPPLFLLPLLDPKHPQTPFMKPFPTLSTAFNKAPIVESIHFATKGTGFLLACSLYITEIAYRVFFVPFLRLSGATVQTNSAIRAEIA